MNCPQCKKELPDGALFCHGCGTKVVTNPTISEKTKATPDASIAMSTPSIRENLEPRNPFTAMFRRYFDFSGRSSRMEVAAILLTWAIVTFLLSPVLVYAFVLVDSKVFGADYTIPCSALFLVGVIYTISTYVPGIAVIVRRFHDTGKSGWTAWMFFTGIFTVWTVWAFFQPSQPGPNRYGAQPRRG